MIRTLVTASSALARAGLAAVVRGDARLELVGDAQPNELEARVIALDPDVILEQR
ncbi:MAG: DNA-binding response regulator, partial [Candidatus Eremiobacteraeota bacterium]|nr:DNA-binding response regulator [Candidatus Eremiobacteraeota bacterium]